MTKRSGGLIAFLLVFWAISASATTYYVKKTGNDANTCVQAQNANTPKLTIASGVGCLAAGDTVVVFAGTYNEDVTVSAGTTGNYKTVTVNGSDVVTLGDPNNASTPGSFTLNSYTKLSGFSLVRLGTCISLNSSATNVYIGPNNSLTQCGTIGIAIGNSQIFIQGNTFAYAGCASTNPGPTCGRQFNVFGSNVLIENNDFSHYQLAIVYGGTSPISNLIFRNNTFHDQLETEAGSNGHTDSIFSEPQTGVTKVLIEGNYQRNAVGPNAKGFLSQNDSGCATTTPACNGIIVRFNVTSRLGSGTITNDKTWPNVKSYNNTEVDNNMDVSTTFAISDNSITAANAAFKNQIYYYTQGSISNFNPYACNNTDCTYGSNLYWCTGTCSSIWGHTYGSGAFTSDPGNKNQNPLFVSYVSAGNAANDYHLQSGSPAKGAGTYLTTATNTGTDTTLTVADATFFQDGYGFPNTLVQGDCIAVNTSSNNACITSISGNTLNLSSSIPHASGQPVYLYKKSDGVQVWTNGLANPDMGAYPTSGAAPTYSISGAITNAAGSTQPSNVSVACSPCTPTQTTLNGQSTSYSFTGLTSGTSYTVTPTQSTYTFSPACSGTISANVTCNFTATGTPTAALSPTSIAFGSQGIGITSAGQTTLLTNNGTGPLTGISVSITGPNAADFSQSNTCSATLNAQANCAITASFTPSFAGSESASISVTDSLGTQTVALSGTGYVPPTPSCTPAGGTYKSGRIVTCTNAVSLATMCWNMTTPPTTNGAGTCTSGTTYTGSFMVTNTGTLYVVGTQSGNIDATVSYSFTIKGGQWNKGWVMNVPEITASTSFGKRFSTSYVRPDYIGQGVRTDLNAITWPTVPPQMGPNVCTAGNLHSCGNQTMRPTPSDNCAVDSDFGYLGCRLTDINTGRPAVHFSDLVIATSGSGDEQIFNSNSPPDRLIIGDVAGGVSMPLLFSDNGTSMTASRMYVSSLPASNGFTFLGYKAINWARSRSAPYIAYGLTDDGTPRLVHFDFTSTTTPPSAVVDFDYTTCLNASVGGTFGGITWVANGASNSDDSAFGYAFSNSGGQAGTGANYVAVWKRGQGCRVLNLATLSVTGDWGPTGPITGTNVAPNFVKIHNVKMAKGVNAIGVVGNPNGADAPSGYVWFWDSLTLQPVCAVGAQCGGHWTYGMTHWFDNPGNAPPNKFDIRNIGNATGFTGVTASIPPVDFTDWHGGWNSLDDSFPVFGTTANIPPTAYIVPGQVGGSTEILGMWPFLAPMMRFAKTLTEGANPEFNTKNAIGGVSADGRYYALTTDWMGTLGAASSNGLTGGTTCDNSATPCRSDVFVFRLTK